MSAVALAPVGCACAGVSADLEGGHAGLTTKVLASPVKRSVPEPPASRKPLLIRSKSLRTCNRPFEAATIVTVLPDPRLTVEFLSTALEPAECPLQQFVLFLAVDGD